MPKLLNLKKIYAEQVFALILNSYRDEKINPIFQHPALGKLGYINCVIYVIFYPKP